MDILFVSSQVIHCHIKLLSNDCDFLVSFVYGMNSISDRKALWTDLSSLSSPLSWCILGDFNAIKNLNETDREGALWNSGMKDLKECLLALEMDDIRGIGPFFTWWNSQTENPIHKKLDRALGNASWLNSFPLAQASYAPRGVSDHSHVILNTGIPLVKSRKPFQFFNHLILLDGFNECVASAWQQHDPGNPFHALSAKLRRTKQALIHLNHSIGNLSSSVKNATAELHRVQNLISSRPQDATLLSQE